MITRPLLCVIVCFGFFILIQSLVPKVMAMKHSNVDEYMLEDQRTRKRKNYVVRLARDSEILGKPGNVGTNYDTDSFQLEPANPDELSAFIVDYANMIRNDVILLDKSVETRTRKRGNIKVEKYNNQALPDPPCACKFSPNRTDLGENTYPRYIETRNCSQARQQSCRPPYVCRENYYNITIIRRKEFQNQATLEDIPHDLKFRWVAENYPVSVGCVCTRDYYATEK
uniref:Prothoracicotropic hormone n=2 Tax=Helicoverpa armigera TaxID=29058 RepID=Q7Z1Z6_HELAM|nr:prothoracicotropic hormone [Helicoverpa armigera]AAV41398.1 prothoracicotropic hormone [Helicoverpa armigera]WGD18941.1 prothoracicotropic hormone [Helicoverpa armigera]